MKNNIDFSQAYVIRICLLAHSFGPLLQVVVVQAVNVPGDEGQGGRGLRR